MKDNNGKPIYFDSIDNSAYILGKSPHSARKSWIFINGEYLNAIRVDIGGDPNEPWVNIAWKFVWTAKDPGSDPARTRVRSRRCTTSPWIPIEKYDMVFNGAEGDMNGLTDLTGKYAGEDNGWSAGLFSVVLADFDKSIMKYPSIQRFPGGASNDLIPDFSILRTRYQLLDPNNMPKAGAGVD